MVHREVAHHASFYLHLLGVCFPFHLVACFKLVFLHHVHRLEHSDALFVEIAVEALRAASLAVETALLSFLFPFVAVSITVEADGFAGKDVFANNIDDGACLVFALSDESVYATLEVVESLCHSGVEYYHSACTVGLRTYGTEFESVTGKCERRCAVAVGIIDEQFRNLWNVELHALLASKIEEFVFVSLLDMVEQVAELLTEEA